MSTLNKWIRQIHRWLGIPFIIAIIILIIGTVQQGENYVSPDWLGVLGIVSLLSLFLTGVYMFGQHYLAKWRRAARIKQPLQAKDSL